MEKTVMRETQLPLLLDIHGEPLTHKRDTDVALLQEILKTQTGTSGGRITAPFVQTSWIYAIITALASSLAEMPFGLWKPTAGKKGSRYTMQNYVPVVGTPINDLIRKPNPIQRWHEFIEQWVTFLALGGNVWCLKDEANSFGVPRALLLFPTGAVSAVRMRPSDPPQAWRIKNSKGEVVTIPLNRMIHWKLPNAYDQWMGMAPWLAMDTQLDAERARILYDRFFYENNATPDAVMTYKPGPLNKTTRDMIYDAWYENHGGPSNAGSLAVIGGDFDIKVLGLSHSATDYINNRKFTAKEISSMYHYPVQLLNDIEGGGLGKDQLSVARQLKYENCVFPYGTKFAAGFTEGIVDEFAPGQNIEAHFDSDGLPVMIDFMESKANILQKLVQSGVPLNQALAKVDMGLEPIDGGDVGFIQSNLTPISTAEENANAAATAKIQSLAVTKQATVAITDKVPVKEKTMKQEWSESIRLFDNMIEICSRKIKRALFNMRNDAYSHLSQNKPFDIESAHEQWNGILRGIHLIGVKTGLDVAVNHQTSINTEEETEKLLQNLRKMPIDNFDDSIRVNLIKFGERSAYIIETLYEEIENAQDREKQIKITFDKLYEVARSIALQELIWSYNLGIKMSNRKFTVQSNGSCFINHRGWPGNPEIDYFSSHSCYCVAQPEA